MNEERLRRRIGIYGGTFDPVHNGHLRVAEAVSKAFDLDQVFLAPAFTPPHKRKRAISAPFHRMAMLALATADSPEMFISTVELEAPSRPYTIETLGRLRTELRPARLFFVMGADSFDDVTSWREYEAILSEYDVIVAMRPGCRGRDDNDGEQIGGEYPHVHGEKTVESLSPELRSRIVDLRGALLPSDEDLKSPRIYLTDYVSIDVSATAVREAARQGRSIDELVPQSVAAYIEKYRLYQKT